MLFLRNIHVFICWLEQPGHHGCALGERPLRASRDPELVTLLPLFADVSEIARGLGGFEDKGLVPVHFNYSPTAQPLSAAILKDKAILLCQSLPAALGGISQGFCLPGAVQTLPAEVPGRASRVWCWGAPGRHQDQHWDVRAQPSTESVGRDPGKQDSVLET